MLARAAAAPPADQARLRARADAIAAERHQQLHIEIPTIHPWLRRIHDGFCELRDERQYLQGGGATQMSYLAREAWLDRNGYRGNARVRARHLLLAMDRQYLTSLRAAARQP